MLVNFLFIVGAVGLFLYGLNLLCSGMQKLTGDSFKNMLPWMQKNPVNSILSGFRITAILESSSAATVLVVGFVNAGLLTLAHAILVIMGANIGASFTTWVIAIFGFELDIRFFTYPLIALGFILMMMKTPRRKNIGEAILGFGLLFLGISYLLSDFPTVHEASSKAVNFVDSLTGSGFLSVLLFMALGCVLAFILQSTGAVTMTMIMFSTGWIGFDMAAAMVLGENIGTTIAANIAASEANVNAKRAALVHTLFNIFGVIMALALFKPFLQWTGWIVSVSGFSNPYNILSAGTKEAVCAGVFGIASFHMFFNLFNTCILAWFTKPIEKLVILLVKESDASPALDSRLKFISSRHFGNASISIDMAFKEVSHFADTMFDGFDNIEKAVNEQDPDIFEKYRVNLVQLEELSDRLEYQIALFLNKVSEGPLNEEEAEKIKVLYRVIGELESLGDSGENISRILGRERIHNRKFDAEADSKINLMIDLVRKAYKVMIDNLKLAAYGRVTDITEAYRDEDIINDTRNKLREESINEIEHHIGNYQSLNYFLDIISELETMGDFMINISQAVVQNND